MKKHLFIIYASLLFLLLLMLVPRPYIRALRHSLMKPNMWLWVRMSKIHQRLQRELWQEGNGDSHD